MPAMQTVRPHQGQLVSSQPIRRQGRTTWSALSQWEESVGPGNRACNLFMMEWHQAATELSPANNGQSGLWVIFNNFDKIFSSQYNIPGCSKARQKIHHDHIYYFLSVDVKTRCRMNLRSQVSRYQSIAVFRCRVTDKNIAATALVRQIISPAFYGQSYFMAYYLLLVLPCIYLRNNIFYWPEIVCSV